MCYNTIYLHFYILFYRVGKRSVPLSVIQMTKVNHKTQRCSNKQRLIFLSLTFSIAMTMVVYLAYTLYFKETAFINKRYSTSLID